MNQGGDVAEQVLRMSLNGVEMTAKITGAAAKQIAVLLYTLLKQNNKTKGPMFLKNMLRSGKELRLFALPQTDLKRFCEEAKHYGIVYSVIRSPKAKDGLVDIMVRAEDAGRLNSIFDRFKLAKVDLAAISTELEKSIAEKQQAPAPVVNEKDADALVNAMLGNEVSSDAQETTSIQEVSAKTPENPTQAQESPSAQAAAKTAPVRSRTLSPTNGAPQKNLQTKNVSPSAPSSRATSEEQTSFVEQDNKRDKSARPSVRKELDTISQKRSQQKATAPTTKSIPTQSKSPKKPKMKGR